jgi:hypothetical protein
MSGSRRGDCFHGIVEGLTDRVDGEVNQVNGELRRLIILEPDMRGGS